MGPESTSFLRRHRRQVLPVLTLASLSALAAAALTSTYTRAPMGAGVAHNPAPATPARPASLLAASAKAAALVASPVRGAATPAVATPGWVGIANKGLALQSGLTATDATSAEPMQIKVSLKLRDFQGLQNFIVSAHTAGSPVYGTVLTTQQFNDTYAPTAAQAQAVSDYLATKGFRNISVASNRALITADGTVGLAEGAFNTHLANTTWQGKSVRINTTDAMVPSALGDTVLSVHGLNTVPAFHLHHTVLNPTEAAALSTPQAGTPATHAGYTGPQFATAYDANAMPPAYATTIAISTGGDDLSAVVAALRRAERITGRPPVPIKIVNTVTPVPTTPAVENDEEWALDSQSSTGLAENVNQLIFYNAVGLADISTLNQFATDNVARIANLSVGGCENLDVLLAEAGPDEQAFAQAAAQGQTWFISSGDEGSACALAANTGTPAGQQDVEYPASSPWVVGVGGTELMTDGNSGYVSEQAWFGGGGGMSNFFAPPKWQSASGVLMPTTVGSGAVGTPESTVLGAGSMIPPNTVTGTGPAGGVPASEAGAGRGVPDVAMSADPFSGLNLFYDDIVLTIGGTSLAAPLSVGSYARIQTAHCNTLGFAAPLFYGLDTTKGQQSLAKGFTDITTGLNGAYMATTGWDYTTGFGSFDVLKVSQALGTASGCVLNQRPVARLAANQIAGSKTLSTIFSGSGTTDPEGDQIVEYAIDYGDGGDYDIQTAPVFAAHTYKNPGKYTATLFARDAAGNFSLPVSQDVTVYGSPLTCTAPGQLLGISPAGVNPGTNGEDVGQGEDDLTAFSVAEPSALTNQLVFTLKVANLSTTPTPIPGFRWSTFFNIPEDPANNYYVSMVSSNGPAPVFEYGTRSLTDDQAKTITTFNALGTLDASSNFTSDGTITLVLNKSALKLVSGDTLTRLAAQVATSAPVSTSGGSTQLPSPAGQQDNAGQFPSYTLIGNDVCKAGGLMAPTPTTGGMVTPVTGGMTTPTTGGMTTPTTGTTGGGGGMGGSPTTGSSPTPTTKPSGGTTPVPSTTSAILSGTNSSGGSYGRGGAGGALGWMVLLPLSAGALRRRRAGSR